MFRFKTIGCFFLAALPGKLYLSDKETEYHVGLSQSVSRELEFPNQKLTLCNSKRAKAYTTCSSKGIHLAFSIPAREQWS